MSFVTDRPAFWSRPEPPALWPQEFSTCSAIERRRGPWLVAPPSTSGRSLGSKPLSLARPLSTGISLLARLQLGSKITKARVNIRVSGPLRARCRGNDRGQVYEDKTCHRRCRLCRKPRMQSVGAEAVSGSVALQG